MSSMRLWSVLASLLLIAIGCKTPENGTEAETETVTSEPPPNAAAVCGRYYRGDGLGYNIYLTLEADGRYAAEWWGCLGKYGEGNGTWRLEGRRIIFSPSHETGAMEGYLRTLEALRFEGDWILVPTRKEDRIFYEKSGVSRFSCFQKRERVR